MLRPYESELLQNSSKSMSLETLHLNASEFASVLPPKGQPNRSASPAAIAFGTALGLHPLVAEVLWRRGHHTLESARAFLDPADYTPASPFELPDMAVAVERLHRAIGAQEPIRVWGDFDVDGQTSTSLLFLGLRALGAKVDYTHSQPRRSQPRPQQAQPAKGQRRGHSPDPDLRLRRHRF